jgi:hypothetical protein
MNDKMAGFGKTIYPEITQDRIPEKRKIPFQKWIPVEIQTSEILFQIVQEIL